MLFSPLWDLVRRQVSIVCPLCPYARTGIWGRKEKKAGRNSDIVENGASCLECGLQSWFRVTHREQRQGGYCCGGQRCCPLPSATCQPALCVPWDLELLCTRPLDGDHVFISPWEGVLTQSKGTRVFLVQVWAFQQGIQKIQGQAKPNGLWVPDGLCVCHELSTLFLPQLRKLRLPCGTFTENSNVEKGASGSRAVTKCYGMLDVSF